MTEKQIVLGVLALPVVLVSTAGFVAIVLTGGATGLSGFVLCGALAFDALLREQPLGSNRYEDLEFVAAMALAMILVMALLYV